VSDVGADCSVDGLVLQFLRGGGSPDASAVLLAGSLSDGHIAARRAAGIESADFRGELAHVGSLASFPAPRSPRSRASAILGIRFALRLRALERFGFDQDAPTLQVSATASANDRLACRVFSGTSGERAVAGLEEDQTGEVHTGEA
jgi:hypothetical protein